MSKELEQMNDDSDQQMTGLFYQKGLRGNEINLAKQIFSETKGNVDEIAQTILSKRVNPPAERQS